MTEQTIVDAVEALERYRVDNDITYQQLLEISDKTIRKLIYSKPISPHVRKVFAEIWKRLSEIMD